MALNSLGISVLRGNPALRQRIMEKTGIARDTMYRWVRENHRHLTFENVLAVIREETGLNNEQLLEPEKVEA